MYVAGLWLGRYWGLNLKKLVNRDYIDVSVPGIAYQLAHGRGLGEPKPGLEGWLVQPRTWTKKASRFDWGFNHG